jgi:hypothetical protein
MLAGALDLDLTIAYTDIITRGVDGRRTGEYATIAHAKARAMPRALHDITLQRPFSQRAARMRARR